MPTFKAEVQPHQLRSDGTYPVSIRITHNRKVARIATGLYLTPNQINKKTFEIKDQAILVWTNNAIRKFREQLLDISMEDMLVMDVQEIKSFLSHEKEQIDYLAYCKRLAASETNKMANIDSVVSLLEEMGITKLPITSFNSKFIERVKEFMDNKEFVRKNGEVCHYENSTKNNYLGKLGRIFNLMKKEYNSDFNEVIRHKVTIERYKEEENKKKAINIEELRRFIEHVPKAKSQQKAKDICLLSFALCGINTIDLLALPKEYYNNGVLEYNRSKTGVSTGLKVPSQILPIFNKYIAKKGNKLFDFGTWDEPNRMNASIRFCLKYICRDIGAEETWSIYWFRHTFATIARNDIRATKDDVDMCIAHKGDNPMADVYIKKDWAICTDINKRVMDYVFDNKKRPLVSQRRGI